MNCDQVTERLAAYALDALPDDEHIEVEAHLESCDAHADALALQHAAARLAAAAPEREPPAALRDRIAEAARAQRRGSPSAAPPTPTTPTSDASRFRRFMPLALAAAIAVVLISFVGLNVLGGDDDGTVTRTASANGVSTTLVYSPANGAGSVSFDGLPPLSADQTYQLWTIAPDQPAASAGLLDRRDDGTASTSIAGDFEPGTTFAITAEPAGGSDQPTSSPLVATEL